MGGSNRPVDALDESLLEEVNSCIDLPLLRPADRFVTGTIITNLFYRSNI